jgi:hypothetical protein
LRRTWIRFQGASMGACFLPVPKDATKQPIFFPERGNGVLFPGIKGSDLAVMVDPP